MRLSHPVDDGGYSEIRKSVEHLFDAAGEGPSLAELDEFGIFDMFDAVPDVAVPALFEAQGALLGTGATVEAFVIHGLRGANAELPPGEIGLLFDVGVQTLGLAPRATPAAWLYVRPGRAGAFLLPGDAPMMPVASIDPTLRVVKAAVLDEGVAVLATDTRPECHIYIAIGAQLTGVAEQILSVARDHARIREQFGRPIASFQAVQQLLADAAVATASGQSLVRAALAELRVDRGAKRAVFAALVAAGAGARAYTVAARVGLQVLGAVAYTIEHEFAGYFRRGQLLAHLVSHSDLDARVAAAACAAGVPEILPVNSWHRVAEGKAAL